MCVRGERERASNLYFLNGDYMLIEKHSSAGNVLTLTNATRSNKVAANETQMLFCAFFREDTEI